MPKLIKIASLSALVAGSVAGFADVQPEGNAAGLIHREARDEFAKPLRDL
jgi:hypothetical protein